MENQQSTPPPSNNPFTNVSDQAQLATPSTGDTQLTTSGVHFIAPRKSHLESSDGVMTLNGGVLTFTPFSGTALPLFNVQDLTKIMSMSGRRANTGRLLSLYANKELYGFRFPDDASASAQPNNDAWATVLHRAAPAAKVTNGVKLQHMISCWIVIVIGLAITVAAFFAYMGSIVPNGYIKTTGIVVTSIPDSNECGNERGEISCISVVQFTSNQGREITYKDSTFLPIGTTLQVAYKSSDPAEAKTLSAPAAAYALAIPGILLASGGGIYLVMLKRNHIS